MMKQSTLKASNLQRLYKAGSDNLPDSKRMDSTTHRVSTSGDFKLFRFGIITVLFAVLGTCPFVASAQAPVSFKARASSTTVSIDENFQIFYILENASAEDFEPPSFKNFEVLSGPNYSSNVQFSNGKVFKREEYSFILKPGKTGTFRIGPATITTGNKKLKSNDLTIKVVNELPKKEAEGEELFVKIELSTDSVFLGQQLLLNYKVYTKVNVERYSFEKEPAYDGFYAEELDRFFSPTTTEIINDESYTTKIIRRLALFPLKTGTHEIEAAELNFIVSENRGFLFRRNVKNIKKRTQAVTVTVLPLPDGAPPTFSGAVGNFSFEARLQSNQLSVGEGTSLIYLITGNGDPKRVQPPVIPSNDTFEFYKPTIINEKIDSRSNGEFLQQIQVEYYLIPKLAGNFTLQPQFSYFDPDSRKYITLETEPLKASVLESSKPISANRENAEEEVSIRPPKKITSLKRKEDSFFNSLAFWTLLCLPVLFLLAVRLKDSLKSTYAGRSSLKKENLQDLLNIINNATHSSETDLNSAFSSINEAFRRFLIWKFSLPPGFSKVELQSALKRQAVDDELSAQLISLMEKIEYGVYSPVKSREQMLDIATETSRVMQALSQL